MKNFFTLFLFVLLAGSAGAQTLLSETFEGGVVPSGWTQETTASDGGWKVGTAGTLSSTYFPIPDNGTKVIATNDDGCNCDKSDEYLILPALDLTTYTDLYLTFDVFYVAGVYNNVYETATVEVSTDGGTTWAVVNTLEGATDWVYKYTIDLSAYAGNSSVQIAFHYADGGEWLYGYVLDNVKVYVPLANDVEVTKLTTTRFHEMGSDVDITGTVSNNGLEPLSSFTLTLSDGVNTYDEVVTLATPIEFGESTEFTSSTPINVAQAISYNFTVTVDNPNAVVDGDPANNQIGGVVSGVTYIPVKKMYVEEATGTWCGWCPRGTDFMEYMADVYPDEFVGIAVHNEDPMAVPAYDAGVGAFPGFSGYPSVIIDRSEIWDPSDMETVLSEYTSRVAPIAPTIEGSMDVATRTLTLDASAEFVTQLEGLDYRLNVILSEDDVHGTTSGYNQTNYYNGDVDPLPGYGYDWQDEAASVPAAKMYYDHVGRMLMDGWGGAAGSLPASVIAGDVTDKNYTVNNFDTNMNPFNMHAVVIVVDNATGKVLNAESKELDVVCPSDFGASFVVTPADQGTANGAVTVTPPSSTFGWGGYTYLWSNGTATANLEGVAAGDYTLVISDKIGCSQTITQTVNLASAVTDIKTISSLVLTPNPASSNSMLEVNFTEAVNLNVQVVNMAGSVVENVQFDRVSSVRHGFDLSSYADGVYLVKLSVGDQVRTEKLIVTK